METLNDESRIFLKGLELLDAHNIEYRLKNTNFALPELKDVQVLSEYMSKGEYGADWISCPPTIAGIYQFLGY